MDNKQIQEEYGAICKELDSLTAAGEKGVLSEDQIKRGDELFARKTDLEPQIETIQRLGSWGSKAPRVSLSNTIREVKKPVEITRKDMSLAFNAWLLHQVGGSKHLKRSHYDACEKVNFSITSPSWDWTTPAYGEEVEIAR